MSKTWGIEQVWNETLVQQQRVTEPRDRIYASEIGKNYWERYQKMMGVQPTEKYENRILRKFAAGNWFEAMIINVFKQIGIFVSSNDRLTIPANDKHLEITVKPDLIAGGQNDWDEARKNLEASGLEDIMKEIGFNLIDEFEKKFPGGLEEKLLEIKTVNSQVFWAKKDYLEEAYPFHTMQCYTGLKQTGIKDGVVVYISKDDLTMKEFPLTLGADDLEERWNKDVEEMTKFYLNKKEPPKPESVVFDKRKKYKFTKNKEKYATEGAYCTNWEVDWSSYFTLLTGKDHKAWEIGCRPEVNKLNAELKIKQFPNLFK